VSFGQRLQEIRDGFEPAFWVANISEIFERLSYYGAFSSLANYLHESLNIPTEQTGALAGLFGGMVWFLSRSWEERWRTGWVSAGHSPWRI